MCYLIIKHLRALTPNSPPETLNKRESPSCPVNNEEALGRRQRVTNLEIPIPALVPGSHFEYVFLRALRVVWSSSGMGRGGGKQGSGFLHFLSLIL